MGKCFGFQERGSKRGQLVCELKEDKWSGITEQTTSPSNKKGESDLGLKNGTLVEDL